MMFQGPASYPFPQHLMNPQYIENGNFSDGGSDYWSGEDAAASDSLLLSMVQSYDWAGALARLACFPSEARDVGMQGRTPLHIACDHDAPAVLIRALLEAYPEASTMVGTSNMNPLHITCSSQHASVHVVRVLLESGRDQQCQMRDVDGDTPLHAACRCGAPMEVLEVLLRANPSAVNERDYEGLTPLLRLWVRYFVILGDDVIDGVKGAADLTDELGEAWKKTELLLRCAHHGSLDLPGTETTFRAAHAAAAVDCPRPIVKIAATVYPKQLAEKDKDGNTPLAIAANAPIFQVRDLSDEGYAIEDMIHGDDAGSAGGFDQSDQQQSEESAGASSSVNQPSVIEILLNANLEGASSAACLHDARGRLPLHAAVESGKRWEEGIKHLVEAYPEAITTPSKSSKLYPFMIAAMGPRGDVGTAYDLLRLNPSLIDDLAPR